MSVLFELYPALPINGLRMGHNILTEQQIKPMSMKSLKFVQSLKFVLLSKIIFIK